jgi:hypothetical protein
MDPTTIKNPPKQPLLSLRRIVIALILLAAVVFLVWSWKGAPDSSGGGNGCVVPAVVAFDPCPGSHILRQAEVGVELQPGYDGRISINGTEIPEDQMQGAILPGTDAYARLTPEERRLGPRPNNKNIVKFQPGKGKIIDKFNGEVHVNVRYWKLSEGEDSAGEPLDYTIFVT